jgi:peptidoglycan-associated lipoprotein
MAATGGAAAGAAGASAAGGAGAGQGVSGAMRPEPREFTAVREIQDVHFDFDRYDIRPDAARTLNANAEWLRSHPSEPILIEGHCDDRGTNEYNLALGHHRAESTANYLVAQGIQQSRITVISYGEERPLCTDDTEACWAKNRRAHILVKRR